MELNYDFMFYSYLIWGIIKIIICFNIYENNNYVFMKKYIQCFYIYIYKIYLHKKRLGYFVKNLIKQKLNT